jgi:hypothetical protein
MRVSLVWHIDASLNWARSHLYHWKACAFIRLIWCDLSNLWDQSNIMKCYCTIDRRTIRDWEWQFWFEAYINDRTVICTKYCHDLLCPNTCMTKHRMHRYVWLQHCSAIRRVNPFKLILNVQSMWTSHAFLTGWSCQRYYDFPPIDLGLSMN